MDGFSGSFTSDDCPSARADGRARFAGPADREHFLDAQRRHRRRTWRAAALGIPAVMIAGIPLCVIVAPILLAPVIALGFVLSGFGLLPSEGWSWIQQATHILPDSWSAIRHGTPVSPGLVAGVFLIPGAVTMLALWLGLRLLLGKAWIESVLARLGGRPPDPRRPAEKELCNIAEELAVAAAVRPPRVLVIDAKQANATIVGHDNDEAVLLVSTGLLKRLDRSETQALLAHLIASVGNGDLRIAASFFSIFQAWGALSLLIETPLSAEARGSLGRTWRALRNAAAGRRDPELERQVVDELLEGANGAKSAADEYLCEAEFSEVPPKPFPFDLLFALRDLALTLTSCIFAITARLAITLCTALVFGPPISALWRSRRRLADAAAVELTRQPAALASAVENLHAARTDVPGGEPVAFLFPLWPKVEMTEENMDIGSCVLGMQLDPHKRLQALRRLGSDREVTIALSGWEGWRKELKDLPQLLLWGGFALALLGLLMTLSLVGLGALLLLLWEVLELAMVDAPAWIGGAS
jgi:Zn-dependent protease with chaperone function